MEAPVGDVMGGVGVVGVVGVVGGGECGEYGMCGECDGDRKDDEVEGAPRGGPGEGVGTEVEEKGGEAREEEENIESCSLEELTEYVCWSRTVDGVLLGLVSGTDEEEVELMVSLTAILECTSRSRSDRFVEWSELVRGVGRMRGDRVMGRMIVAMKKIFGREIESEDKHRGQVHAAQCLRFLREAAEEGWVVEVPEEWQEEGFVEALSLVARMCDEAEEIGRAHV
jgi:hypothetical protein